MVSRRLNRRAWLASAGAGLSAFVARSGAGQTPPPAAAGAQGAADTLALKDFQPRSMLVVPQHPVERARYPVVDVHTHPTFRARVVNGVPQGEANDSRTPAAALLTLMERRNVRTLVNLTGGVGSGLAETVRTFQVPHPGRFVVFTEPSFDRIAEAGYAELAGRRARARQGRRRQRTEDPEGPRTVPPRAGRQRSSREGRRCRASTRCGKPAGRSVSRSRCTCRIRRRSFCRSTPTTSATKS